MPSKRLVPEPKNWNGRFALLIGGGSIDRKWSANCEADERRSLSREVTVSWLGSAHAGR